MSEQKAEKAVDKVGQVLDTAAHTAERNVSSFADGAAKMADAILMKIADFGTTPPPITAEEALRNKELQAQFFAQRTAQMQAKAKENDALRQMARDKETGRGLDFHDVANLEPATLSEIRAKGDAFLVERIERQVADDKKWQLIRKGRGR